MAGSSPESWGQLAGSRCLRIIRILLSTKTNDLEEVPREEADKRSRLREFQGTPTQRLRKRRWYGRLGKAILETVQFWEKPKKGFSGRCGYCIKCFGWSSVMRGEKRCLGPLELVTDDLSQSNYNEMMSSKLALSWRKNGMWGNEIQSICIICSNVQ